MFTEFLLYACICWLVGRIATYIQILEEFRFRKRRQSTYVAWDRGVKSR